MRFVCTDRGRHPEIRLGSWGAQVRFRIDSDTRHLVNEGVVGYGLPEMETTSRIEVVAAPDGHRTVRLRCPHRRCGRDVVWREERAIAIEEQATSAGLSVLDISRFV